MDNIIIEQSYIDDITELNQYINEFTDCFDNNMNKQENISEKQLLEKQLKIIEKQKYINLKYEKSFQN